MNKNMTSKRRASELALIFTMATLFTFGQIGLSLAGDIPIEPKKDVPPGYLLLLPRTSDQTYPILIVLPGKNVLASSEQNNWKFSASKNKFAMVVLDVDYDSIQSDEAFVKFYDRIRSTVESLNPPNVSLDKTKVYLAGTSMGGMMAIALTLRYPMDFVATSVVCGSRLYFGAKQTLANAKGRQFYLVHGSEDNVVPVQSFEETKSALEHHGAMVTSKIIPGGGHIISGAYTEAVNWLALQKTK